MTGIRTVLLLACSVIAASSAPSPGAAQSYAIGPFGVELELLADGNYQVEERIRFRLQEGTFSEAFRTIPTSSGISLRNVEVTSPDTPIENIEQRTSRGNLEITWEYPDRSDPVTFTLRYRVDGGLIATEGENVIEWDPVGTAWEVPVEDVDVQVSWPPLDLVRDDIRFEPTDDADLEEGDEGWRVTFRAAEVPQGAGMGIQVRFPQRLSGRDPAEERGPDPGPGVLAFLVAAAAGLLALIVGRNPSASVGRGPTDPPRESLDRIGYLAASPMDEWPRLMPRIFGATLVRMAREGRVTLRRVQEGEGEGGDDKGDRLEVEVHEEGVEGATKLEAALLDEVDRHGSFEVFLKEGGPFQKECYRRIRSDLVEVGLLSDHTTRSNRLIVLGAAAIPAFLLAGWELSGVAAVVAFGLAIGIPAGAFLAALRRFTRTEDGARLRAETTRFLDRVRSKIEESRDRDPSDAARLLAEHLEWMILDPQVTGAWLGKVEEAIREARVRMEVPLWLESAVGRDEDMAVAPALTPLYLTVILGGPTSAGGSGFSGAGASVGVGATTGVGGGGGGVR